MSEDFDAKVKRALGYLLRATSARPLTVAEARERLATRELDARVAEAVVEQATELGALDDAAFARIWVQDRGHRRGYAASRLKTELARRQVPAHLVEAALADLAEERDDLEVATELARARAQRLPASLPPETVARRVAAFVARRGYPPTIAQRAALTVTRAGDPWD